MRPDSDPSDGPFGGSRDVLVDGGQLSLDRVFQLLANRRRRYLLYFLSDVGGTTDRDELARRIATWERDAEIDDLPREYLSNVAITLDHAHLPRLATDGVVEYDRQTRTVTATESLARLEPFLELARPMDEGEAEADLS